MAHITPRTPKCLGMATCARRFHAAHLIADGHSPTEASKMTGFKASECLKWAKRMEQTGGVDDLPRAGRPPKVTGPVSKTLKRLALECKPGVGSKDVAAKLREKTGVALSARCVRRSLGAQGLKFSRVKAEPRLTPPMKAKRVTWAERNRDIPWEKVVFTDSKYFYGSYTPDKVKNLKAWSKEGVPRRVPVDKHATLKCHVYGGITIHGATELHYATGTTGYKSNFVYATGKAKGTPHRGVCKREYKEILESGGYGAEVGLLEEARALFMVAEEEDDWFFQQDQPKIHVGCEDVILRSAPNCLEWPGNSPDLSIIENVWAEVERILWKKFTWHNLAEFKGALNSAWREVTENAAYRARLFASMPKRLEKVIAGRGDVV